MASSVGWGAGWNAATIDEAIAAAHAQMDTRGIVYNDPQKYSGVIFQGCGAHHGALAAVPNPWGRPDVYVALTLAFKSGTSQSEAETSALTACKVKPNSAVGECKIQTSW